MLCSTLWILFFFLPPFFSLVLSSAAIINNNNGTNTYTIKKTIAVAPSIMQMQDETGLTLQNGTVIGPLSEGQRFVSYCEARSGRPRPNVGWYLNGKRLPGTFYFHTILLSSRTDFSIRCRRGKKCARKLSWCFLNVFVFFLSVVENSMLSILWGKQKKDTIPRDNVSSDCINKIEWSRRMGWFNSICMQLAAIDWRPGLPRVN